jgi:hypothetical protein
MPGPPETKTKRSNKNSLFDMAAKLKKYAAYTVFQLNALPA